MGSVRGANGEVTEMPFKPRYIKAQEAEERIVALWRKEKGAYADTFNTAPTITSDPDAETRGYIRGYNDAIKTTFKLMLQYGSDREEEEHER